MEADLQRHYQIDYRDRWRRDAAGVPVLTVRRIGVLIEHMPAESALGDIGRNGRPHFTVEANLLDDLRMLWSSSKTSPAKPHPLRFAGRSRSGWDDPKRRPALLDARRRARERRRTREAKEG